jgi:hypothetical protein
MKNAFAIIAALAVGISHKTFDPVLPSGWSLRRDPFGRGKRKVGHNEGIAKGASYNKAILRLWARSEKPDWARP